MSRPKQLIAQIWPRVAIIAAILLVWWIVYATEVYDRVLLPSPASVWEAFTANLTGTGGLLEAAERSVLRLAIGMAAAVAVGTLIGLWVASSKVVQRSVGSLMVGLQALPSISWLPLALLWFGLTESAILFVVIVGAFPAVAIATASSVRLVPPILIRAGRTLGAGGWELYRNVVLPAAVPGYVAGLQQAWAIAWRALMAGELLVTGARGLGHLIVNSPAPFDADASFDTALVLAAMAVIMLIGVAIDWLITIFDRRIRARRGLLVSA